MKKITLVLCLLIFVSACKRQYYTVPVSDFAEQLSKLQIDKDVRWDITFNSTVKSYRTVDEYVNNLQKLYVYDKEGKGDSVYLRGAVVKLYLQNGKNTGYIPLMYKIVKDDYFISIADSNLTVRPRCTYCKIPVDSVVKVVIKN